MYWYCLEKIDVDNFWDLRGFEWVKDKVGLNGTVLPVSYLAQFVNRELINK